MAGAGAGQGGEIHAPVLRHKHTLQAAKLGRRHRQRNKASCDYRAVTELQHHAATTPCTGEGGCPPWVRYALQEEDIFDQEMKLVTV